MRSAGAMSDNRCANGSTGIVWKVARKKLVDARPARSVCTVASFTGPAAVEGRIRGGDKLVAIFRPAAADGNADGVVPKEHGSASPAKTAQRLLRGARERHSGRCATKRRVASVRLLTRMPRH